MRFKRSNRRTFLLAIVIVLGANLTAPGSGAKSLRRAPATEPRNEGCKKPTRARLLQGNSGSGQIDQSNSSLALNGAPDAELKADLNRALAAQAKGGGAARKNGYRPANSQDAKGARPRIFAKQSTRPIPSAAGFSARAFSPASANAGATTGIAPGTPLHRILHTSQLSLTSVAGTDEQYVDRNGDLVADERTTLDAAGGSFDIAVGQSGTRYEVFSATLSGSPVGVLVVVLDTNGDYVA